MPHKYHLNTGGRPASSLQERVENSLSRREFLKKGVLTLAGTAGVFSLPIIGNAQLPPSKRVTVGLIGRGLMGSGHLRRLVGDPSFQVLAVCDVDRSRREEGKETVNQHYAADRDKGTYKGCDAYNDYREMLARPDIDAVLIATPDHWHALQSIDAAKAGKDIYCEKPVSMTIEEGRQLVEAVHRYKRVFQNGSQYRSIPTIRHVCQFIRDGGLGKIKSVFTLMTGLTGFISAERFRPYAKMVNAGLYNKTYVPLDIPMPAEPIPDGLDWDMWVGPAPWRPFNPVYHLNPSPGVVPWSFCDSFGVTSLTWFLSHATDVIQYAIGCENTGPVEIIHPSSGEFPTMTCRYANGVLLHFVDHWGMVSKLYKAVPENARLAGNFGGVIVGERGWLTTLSTGGPIEGSSEELIQQIGLKTREVNIGANNHHANWLECIKTRQLPSSHEEIGHRSAAAGHLANISWWVGHSLKFDPDKEIFHNDEAANRLRGRAMRPPWRM